MRGMQQVINSGAVFDEPESMWQRIAAQAHALYEGRGRRQGNALQDWLDAEYIVHKEIYETH